MFPNRQSHADPGKRPAAREALAMLWRCDKGRRIMRTPDKARDMADFGDSLRDRPIAPHMAVDDRIGKTDKPYATRTDLRTSRHCGLDRVDWMFTPAAAHNLVCLAKTST